MSAAQGSPARVVHGAYATEHGYSLSYEVQGEGEEYVLFVMGFMSNRAYWGDTVARLHQAHPGRYTTCVYDQRGISASTESFFAKYSSKSLGRDILGLLLHLGWLRSRRHPVHLVGWSMGGFACLEFLTCLLDTTNSTLNIVSLVLANTVHKLTLPSACGLYHSFGAVLRGVGACVLGGHGHSIVPHALKMHFSPGFLRLNYEALYTEYSLRRSPFDKPLYKYIRTLLGHARVVLTHYVPRKRMELLRDSKLTMHAVVSTDDVLIHPTASINLANCLQCPFSYVKGGHMHHQEHAADFVQALVSVWERGLASRGGFEYLSKNRAASLAHGSYPSQYLSAPSLVPDSSSGSRPPVQSAGWSEADELKLRAIMAKMDTTTFFNIDRLRNPGRMILFPLLVLPIVLRALRRVRTKQATLGSEAAGLAYILALLLLVQETARVHG